MNVKATLLGAFVAGFLAQPAWASLLAYEGFDYPNDGAETADRTGGSGWSAGWLDADADFAKLTQDDTSLDSAAFPFAPIGDRVAGSGGEASRLFATPFDLSQDGVLYASFLWRKEGDGGTSADNIEFNLGVDGSTLIRFGSTSGDGYLFRIGSGNGDTGSVPFGETQFVVLRLTANATGDDAFEAALYSPGGTVPVGEPAAWDLTATSDRADIINSVRLQFGNNATGAFDEIRIGTTWESVAVVPEPATLALILMISSGMLLGSGGRRRR